ncbi:katanin p60 ATPase-containing subunit a-like 2, partial [Plakobranchus ocellatus]
DEVRTDSRKKNLLILVLNYLNEEGYLDSAANLARETNIDIRRYEVCDNIDLETILMEYESYYFVKFAKYPKITKKLSTQSAGAAEKRSQAKLNRAGSVKSNTPSLPRIPQTRPPTPPQQAPPSGNRPASGTNNRNRRSLNSSTRKGGHASVNGNAQAKENGALNGAVDSLSLQGMTVTGNANGAADPPVPPTPKQKQRFGQIIDVRSMIQDVTKMSAEEGVDPSGGDRILKPLGGYMGYNSEWRELAQVISRAFDRVRHDEIIKQLTQLKIDGKDLRIIKNMYWDQKAAMRVEGEVSKFQNIKRGVRQGCVLSPDLFSLYSEIIMRNLEGHPGIKIGGSNINNLRYADDTVLIAENEKDLQQLLDIVKEESEKKGLELNRKKTEVMVVSRKQELPIINIYIKGTRLKQKDQFKYLGSLISSDGRNNSEVASRIAQVKTNFQKMKTGLTNKNISIRTRRRALECYIEPILMYGCEAWTISKQTRKKLEATEMWFLRRMLRISWTAKKTNDTVLEEAHTTRLLISKIRKRQATFFGHVMRREKLENLVTTGMLEGKRSRGKQREKLIEGLTDWLKAGKSLEAIEATKDRKKWRTMIANADIYSENPNVRWEDIIGLDDSKRLVKEAVVYPIKYPQLFQGILSPWKGLLLYGPPGTGKTLLAKAVATECNTTFFNISASSIVSKWRGDSEKLVRVLFELARFHAPSTIFLDELESLMSQRGSQGGGSEHEGSRRMKTELLVQMDGLSKTDDLVFLLAASNLPWELDHAMLRRLEKRILVDLPTYEARRAMFQHHLPPVVSSKEGGLELMSELDYDVLAVRTEGYSGSDLRLVCKEAAMRPVRKIFYALEHHTEGHELHIHLDKIKTADVLAALERTKPSATTLKQKYADWQKEYESV